MFVGAFPISNGMERLPKMGELGETQETNSENFSDSSMGRQELVDAVRAFQKETEKWKKKRPSGVSGTRISPPSEDVVQAFHGDEGAVPEEPEHERLKKLREELSEN